MSCEASKTALIFSSPPASATVHTQNARNLRCPQMSPRGPSRSGLSSAHTVTACLIQARPIYADLSSRAARRNRLHVLGQHADLEVAVVVAHAAGAEQMPRRHSSLRTVDLPEPLSPTMRRVPKVLSASMWSQIVLIAVAVGWELMWSLVAEGRGGAEIRVLHKI